MNLEIGKQYNVTVVKILAVGAVVELDDKSTELIHISNIADCYVSDVADFVSVGREYVATCEEGVKKPIQLSLKPLRLESQKKSISKKPTERKVRYTKPEKYNNLDEMLASANSQYAEKQQLEIKRNRRR